jgi:hypothetical protein
MSTTSNHLPYLNYISVSFDRKIAMAYTWIIVIAYTSRVFWLFALLKSINVQHIHINTYTSKSFKFSSSLTSFSSSHKILKWGRRDITRKMRAKRSRNFLSRFSLCLMSHSLYLTSYTFHSTIKCLVLKSNRNWENSYFSNSIL